MADGVSKSWVFTLNNYTPEELKQTLLYGQDADVSRMAVAEEKGAAGTPHLQGAVIFKRAKRLSGVRRLLVRAHWERMRGKWDQARAYALKDVTDEHPAVVDINNQHQGSRTDLNEVKAAIMDGVEEEELWRTHFPAMVRYNRGILKAKYMLKPRSNEPLYTIQDFTIPPIRWGVKRKSCILYGPPNTGKTQYALAQFECPLFVTHMDTLSEFIPGKHDGIIFDDMSFMHLPREAQIQLLDSGQGRHIHIRYVRAWIPKMTKKIFITNQEHGAIFNIDDRAIKRRLLMLEVTDPLFAQADSGSETEEDPSQTWEEYNSQQE